MRTVSVNLSGHAYDISIEAGVLGRAGARLRSLTPARSAFLVTDSNVAPLLLAAVTRSLEQADFRVTPHTLPAGEGYKTLEQIGRIYDTLIGGKIDRQGLVIALGGGVVGDMTGFAAATVLRGVPFVQVPTTLLSMVDASVGGKTGVDHALGKNLIGAFHQPMAVLIDPEVLRTLPPRELRSGLAECIKHEIIRDAEGFVRLERDVGKALALDVQYLAELIEHNVAIKARVVEADPFERGERAHLNFGHTFGHAIEAVSDYTLAHGECVALGMIGACRLANLLNLFDQNSVNRVIALIHAAGLPTGNLTVPVDRVFGTMFYDKKVRGGKLRLVLPDAIGRVTIRDDVPPELVRDALATLR